MIICRNLIEATFAPAFRDSINDRFMNMDNYTISGLLTEAAKKLRSDFEFIRTTNPHSGDKGQEAEEILRQFLNHHLPQRFRAAEGIIIDDANQISKQTDVIVYDALTSPVYRYSEKTLILPADTVAAVVEVKSRLNKMDLEDAYKKIASCKALKKKPISDVDQPATGSKLRSIGTFGVVFGFASDTSIATLASHVEELNKQYDWRLWPNMVVILDAGTINYCVQFPGEHLGGDLMPVDADDFLIPPFYIHVALREDGIFSLNRFFTALLAHLNFYPRRLSTPLFNVILEGAAKEAVTVGAYQFDLKRELLPVSLEGREIKLASVIGIEGTQGILGMMQFYEWAGGGVIKWRGQFPLGVLLVMAEMPKETQVLTWGGFQFSSVLRVTEDEFRHWPAKMNSKMSGMKATLVKWNFVEVIDEGTSQPYVARLFSGVAEIRDKTLHSNETKKQFDVAYEPLMKSLIATRKLQKQIQSLGTEKAGELKRSVRECLLNFKRILVALLSVSKVLNVNIDFALGDDHQFEKGIEGLKKGHPTLAEFLAGSRNDWLAGLLPILEEAKNGDGFLAKPQGDVLKSGKSPDGLLIEGVQAIDFLSRVFDRLSVLIEGTCIYGFARLLPQSLSIREIPLAERPTEFPRRFETMLNTGIVSPLKIRYSPASFDEQ
jgi:hypothetical protein